MGIVVNTTIIPMKIDYPNAIRDECHSKTNDSSDDSRRSIHNKNTILTTRVINQS